MLNSNDQQYNQNTKSRTTPLKNNIKKLKKKDHKDVDSSTWKVMVLLDKCSQIKHVN